MCQGATNKPKKKLTFLLLLLGTVASSQVAGSGAALAQIHKRLTRSHGNPIVFIGYVSRLGPVYQEACKEAVNQEVDFTISRLLLGNYSDSVLHTGYINCTRRPLPSPPFTLHATVIVYCEPTTSMACLTPVEFSQERLNQIESWIEARSRRITPR
jgi:hypothetical protein